MPYHCSHSATSLMRKSAAMSMTRTPASTSARACSIATPLGVAKNTRSQPSSAACAGSVNLSATRPRRLGNMLGDRRARLPGAR